MGAEERFELTPEQREWLNSLPPDKRHAASDDLHARWQGLMMIAESMDDTVDLLLPHGRGEASADFFTVTALNAEAFRAMARGDEDKAVELFAAGRQYRPDIAAMKLVFDDRPDDRRTDGHE